MIAVQPRPSDRSLEHYFSDHRTRLLQSLHLLLHRPTVKAQLSCEQCMGRKNRSCGTSLPQVTTRTTISTTRTMMRARSPREVITTTMVWIADPSAKSSHLALPLRANLSMKTNLSTIPRLPLQASKHMMILGRTSYRLELVHESVWLVCAILPVW